MSISRQTLSAVIVTFKSEKVIHDCIKSIPMKSKLSLLTTQMIQNSKKSLKKNTIM